jgi:acyl-coenzyme A synthetase/AMP-(fatty) acid ligase
VRSLAVHSVLESLLVHARERPDSAAFVDGALAVNYAELLQLVQGAAAWLHARGIRPGDTVVLPMDEGAGTALPLMCLVYGAGWLGASAMPLEPGTPAAIRAALLQRNEGAKPIEPAQFDARAAARGTPPARADAGARPFLHVFSSGTTGMPKQMAYTHRGLVAHAEKYQRHVGIRAGDRLVGSNPFPSKTGLRYLRIAHVCGATFMNVPVPGARRGLARLIRDEGMTLLICAPAQLRQLLRSRPKPGARLPPFRLLSGAAPMSHEEIRQVREELTADFYRNYSATECGLISVLRPEDPVDARSGVGRLVPECEGRVAGQDGAPLAPGEVGQLGFRSECIPAGYIGNPEATARHFRDGWFYPGDLGSIDAEGNVTLSGRKDHVINHGGIMIVPEDIDAVLRSHPDVADAALVGVPHPLLGEVPVAAVVRRRQFPIGELRAYCAATIEQKRMPSIFFAVRRIPRDATGKLRHGLLRDRLARLVAEHERKKNRSAR